MEKVVGWMASYRTAPRTYVVHQSLRQVAQQKVAVGFVRNENTRRTHRAPLTQALPHVLQSFAEAFVNALAVCARTGIEPRSAFWQLPSGREADEGPMAESIWSAKLSV